MFKVIRAIKNNLNEKVYLKHVKDLKLYNKDSKNKVLLDNESQTMERLHELQTDVRKNNLEVYFKNVLKLRGKQFTLTCLPVILGGLTILSFSTTPYELETFDTYQKHEIIFDEEEYIDDKMDEDLYIFTDTEIISNDESVVELLESDGKADIYFGLGETCYHVVYDISSDGVFTVNSYTEEPAFYYADGNNKKELNENHNRLMEEAANVFIESEAYSWNSIKEDINNFLSNNENDILVKIVMYERVGEKEFKNISGIAILRVILILIDCLYVFLAFINRYKLTNVSELKTKYGELETSSYRTRGFRNSLMHYKELFLQAERDRIMLIDDILKNHADDQAILTKYEKKLVLKEKE